MITLRQFQKLFSAAARQKAGFHFETQEQSAVLGDVLSTLRGTTPAVAGAVNYRGDLVDMGECTCHECQRELSVKKLRPRIDSWARKYGPDADIMDVLAQEPTGTPESGESRREDGAEKHGNDPNSAGDGEGEGDAQNDANSDSPGSPADDKPPAQSPQQQKLAAARQALQAAAASLAENPQSAQAQRALQAANQQMKQTRAEASYDSSGEAAGISLVARKNVSRGVARLRNVPPPLRQKMAELINRLVAQGGVTGETLGPIPVLSAKKLVKRMVVRRPLANALKEDIVTGRPVTLFLPDISESCAEQAQPACDLANAAGYAGLPGSDVLVMPHYNGNVKSRINFVQWFNGKPAATKIDDAVALYKQVCRGESRFKVRVAVFVGDHDAVDQYGDVAELPTVTRVIWLHPYYLPKGLIAPAPAKLLPKWAPDAMAKLSMIAGCIDKPSMLAGFDMALRNR